MKRTPPVFELPLYHVRVLRRAVRSALRQTPYELRRRDPRTSESDFASYDLSGQIQAAANLADRTRCWPPKVSRFSINKPPTASKLTSKVRLSSAECGTAAPPCLSRKPIWITGQNVAHFTCSTPPRHSRGTSRCRRVTSRARAWRSDHAHGQLQVAWTTLSGVALAPSAACARSSTASVTPKSSSTSTRGGFRKPFQETLEKSVQSLYSISMAISMSRRASVSNTFTTALFQGDL